MNYIGIDPGLKGGIAILNQQGKVLMLESMPITIQSKYNLFQTFKSSKGTGEEDNVYMEKVSSRPTDSRRGAFTFGYHLGTLHTICDLLGISLVLVSPKTWQLFFGIKREKGESKYGYKKRLLGFARQSRGTSGKRSKQLTLNTCDAYLIALYAYQQSKGNTNEQSN